MWRVRNNGITVLPATNTQTECFRGEDLGAATSQGGGAVGADAPPGRRTTFFGCNL